MKAKCSIIALIVLGLIVFNQLSFAQFRLSLGPTTGMNFNIHTGSDLAESGTGFGFVFAGQTDMSFSPLIGLITTIFFYDNKSGSFSETGQIQDAAGNVYDATASTSTSVAYFQIEPLFKLKIPSSGFYFVGGPSLGFNVESMAEVEINIPKANYKQKSKASIKDMNVRFELKIGSGYDIGISKLITISPQLTFGYGLANVKKDFNWKILSFQLLGTVKFNLI
jgi:hypothetical protein